jgi:dTDP-4-amino-4,6-dideoxygalactose transaminase
MNSNEKIPFLDLVTPHLELEEELVDVFRSAIRTGRFIGGKEVEEFEREFALHCDVDYCVGVGSGTDALRFALIAAGVKQGETVITVPNTFIATTEAITQVGATIGFVDIDERTYNMDPARLKDYLETRCKKDRISGRPVNIETGSLVSAVIPVHLYGQMADMDPIMELAEQYKLIVIEDACQAHGAEYFSQREGCWKKAGSVGHAAAFSFYPGKNLGACGEGGAVTTRYQDIARQVAMLRDHGQSKKYFHEMEGYNGRLDAIQAGILRRKLMHLPKWNESRRQAASEYGELLKDVDGVVVPYRPEWAQCVYHLYVIRVEERDGLRRYLSDNSIDTGLHYPVPLHLQDAYAYLGYKENDFPVSEKIAREMLSVPMYPGLTKSQQQCVADGIRQFVCQTV